MTVAEKVIEKAKQFLGKRRFAYRSIFDKENVYLATVLKDLSKFCRANETTFLPDARAHAVLEGRREVYLRIMAHLNFTEEQLWKLYGEKNNV